MWAMIFMGLILGTAVGLFYLAGRFSRFAIIKKLSRGKKFIGFLIGILPVALIIFCVRAGLGTINAEIAILHLMVIWLLCDGISKLAEKRRKVKFTRYYAGMFALGLRRYICAAAGIWRIMCGAGPIRWRRTKRWEACALCRLRIPMWAIPSTGKNSWSM